MKYRITISSKKAYLAPSSATVIGFLGTTEKVEVLGLTLSQARVLSRACGVPFYQEERGA